MRFLFFAVAAVLMAGVQGTSGSKFMFQQPLQPKAKPADSPDDAQFNRFTDSLLNEFWEWHPSWAVSIGHAKYDAVLEVRTADGLQQRRDQHEKFMRRLARYERKKLNANNRMDYNIL
ncbi:MAG TPA: hypothetical protein VEY71_11210, partial [Chitinophagales bacterium]|nr:hypothetical protein [Chitinophagales bacterium]